jgi:hypothetical protein
MHTCPLCNILPFILFYFIFVLILFFFIRYFFFFFAIRLQLQVKAWARHQGINDGAQGTFNSYTLTIMVLYHLQSFKPPIVPPLMLLVPPDFLAALPVQSSAGVLEPFILASNLHVEGWSNLRESPIVHMNVSMYSFSSSCTSSSIRCDVDVCDL